VTTPISPNGDQVRREWQQALQTGPACLALDRLGEPLSTEEQAHVVGCARCRTELEMFAAYEANEPIAGEGLSVAWIAQRAKRAVHDSAAPAMPAAPAAAPAVVAPKATWGLPRWALAAASLAVVLGGATLLWSPAPSVAPIVPGDIYRASRLEITSPTGDIPAAPAELRLTAVPGAVQYDVRLIEVDGTELWRASTPVTTVLVPQAVAALVLPAKTLIWQIVAKDAQQRVLAESGDVRFRVQPR
jgi:hypothetical protein